MCLKQSSPAPKGGCNTDDRTITIIVEQFQSPPAPKGGCNAISVTAFVVRPVFQSPPRPEGRVQRALRHNFQLHLLVSIPTRPEGRVQPSTCWPVNSSVSFQSSPAPKGGCNSLPLISHYQHLFDV